MSDKKYISKEGLKKLEGELKRLKFTERPTIVAEIKRARELGDLSENAEYHAAKEAQGHIERKISDLEFSLAQVELIDTSDIPSDKVYLFATVKLRDLEDDEVIFYTVVPLEEADIDEDKISVTSPIGKALLGKAVGDVVDIKIPVGVVKYEVLEITRE